MLLFKGATHEPHRSFSAVLKSFWLNKINGADILIKLTNLYNIYNNQEVTAIGCKRQRVPVCPFFFILANLVFLLHSVCSHQYMQ